MTDKSTEIRNILDRVDATLATARLGLDDLLDPSRARRMSGLRNLIAFGRSVTFVLQNLRSVATDFDNWYQPHQESFKADPLMRYFVDARNELEKQGKLSVTTSTHIRSFSGSDIQKLGRPPYGAKSFFIGDQLGGSGWEVELADGTVEKYYVDLPLSLVEVRQQFSNLPETLRPELKGASIEDLSRRYIDRLDSLIRDAKDHFLGGDSSSPPVKIRPSYLKRVK